MVGWAACVSVYSLKRRKVEWRGKNVVQVVAWSGEHYNGKVAMMITVAQGRMKVVL